MNREAIASLIEFANELDEIGAHNAADAVTRLAQKEVTAGYGGGYAEYVQRLLELAKTKGVDYMVARMQEMRIVVLNDGTPIMKQPDSPDFVKALEQRARQLGYKDSGKTPYAPNKVDPKWGNQSADRYQDIASGKSQWLQQVKPISQPAAKPAGGWQPQKDADV
jgi:hypothetical protein